MAEQETKISIENVYKIFGPDPQSVLQRVKDGATKQDILEQTGHTIGIRDVSLDVKAGEIFVVMGLSGSGKSTLIRHINRLIEPTAGRILVDGEDVLQLNPVELRHLRRYKLSMVFQRFALLPHKTVLQNVASGLQIRDTSGSAGQQVGLMPNKTVLQNVASALRLRGTSDHESLERARAQVELVGLAGFENQYPSQLSGGMQQRVGLARALATDADVLLMDEAFSALDPLIRNDMQDQLMEIQSRLHRTIVFITHDLDEALRIGDHIAILKDGELRQVGTPEEIIMNPADDYVSRFVQDVNRGRCVTVGSIAAKVPTVTFKKASFDDAIKTMQTSKSEAVYVVDGKGRPVGAVTKRMSRDGNGLGAKAISDTAKLEKVATVGSETVIDDMLTLTVNSDVPVAVVDDAGGLLGGVQRRTVISALIRSEGAPAAE